MGDDLMHYLDQASIWAGDALATVARRTIAAIGG
jgi:hypothetical protein